MGDYYDVDVVIYGWPSAAVVPRETHRGASFPDELQLDVPLALVCSDDRPPRAWAAVAHAMRVAGWPEHAAIEYEPTWIDDVAEGGVLRVTCENNYGLASINEDPDVLGALRDAGLAFYACDAGSQANLPAFAAWAPGWSAIRSGPATPDGDPLLDIDSYRAIAAALHERWAAGDRVMVHEAITEYFRTRDAVAEAARTEEPK